VKNSWGQGASFPSRKPVLLKIWHIKAAAKLARI